MMYTRIFTGYIVDQSDYWGPDSKAFIGLQTCLGKGLVRI